MSLYYVIERNFVGDETIEQTLDAGKTIEGFCNMIEPLRHIGGYDIYVAALRHDGTWDYVLIYTVDEEHKNFRIGVGPEAFTDFDHAFAAFKEAAESAFKKGFIVSWTEYEAPDEE